jgi:hypothetical protein
VCPFNCSAVPAGLASWLPFDAAAPDASHTLDIRRNESASVSGVAAYQPGKVGSGLVFDGSTTYVEETASASIDVGSGPGFAITGWITPTFNGTYQNIAEWNDGSNVGVFLYVYGSQLYFDVRDVNGNYHGVNTAGVLQQNVFSHVAATYDKASGEASVYINGVSQGGFMASGIRPQTTYDLYLGIRKSTGQYPFLG